MNVQLEQMYKDVLSTSDPLQSFADLYCKFIYGNLSWVQHYSVVRTKIGLGITLFRYKQFQVQLFLLDHNSQFPDHCHPNVDSIEVFICGDTHLTRDGESVTDMKHVFELPDGRSNCNGAMIRIRPGQRHGGHSITSGAFMSIQYWLNDKTPQSIQYDWKGVDGSEAG
jgi:quercetin dioxygenase-like cupin family protein